MRRTYCRAPVRVDVTDRGDRRGRFWSRAFWFYLTAHRLGDLRRLVRQYQRRPNRSSPTGAYHKQSLTRGTQVTFVVPQPEENKPRVRRVGARSERAVKVTSEGGERRAA